MKVLDTKTIKEMIITGRNNEDIKRIDSAAPVQDIRDSMMYNKNSTIALIYEFVWNANNTGFDRIEAVKFYNELLDQSVGYDSKTVNSSTEDMFTFIANTEAAKTKAVNVIANVPDDFFDDLDKPDRPSVTIGCLNNIEDIQIFPINLSQGFILRDGIMKGYYSHNNKMLYIDESEKIPNYFDGYKVNICKVFNLEIHQWVGGHL